MKKSIPIIKFIIAITALCLLIIELLRAFTHWPSFTLYLNTSQATTLREVNVYDYFHKGTAFVYFTTISNIIAVGFLFLSWVCKINIKIKIRLMVLTYMLITSFVFWIGIAPLLPWGQSAYFDFININEHVLVTLLVIWWSFSNYDNQEVKNKYLKMLSYPLMYGLFNILLFLITPTNTVVYPFLKFDNFYSLNLNIGLSIFLTILTFILIGCLFVGVYFLLIKIYIFISKKIKNKMY